MAFANLFLLTERLKHVDALRPYKTEYVCFFIKKPPLNPKWQDLMIPFHLEVWVAILITLVLCFLVVGIMDGILLKRSIYFIDSFMNVFAAFLDKSIPFYGKMK